jgi:hypothetical protein
VGRTRENIFPTSIREVRLFWRITSLRQEPECKFDVAGPPWKGMDQLAVFIVWSSFLV